MRMGAKVPSDRASRERFALTPAVLGIDLCRSAVPSYLFLRSGPTDPALGSQLSTRRQHEIQEQLTCITAMTLFAALATLFS